MEIVTKVDLQITIKEMWRWNHDNFSSFIDFTDINVHSLYKKDQNYRIYSKL